MDALARKQGANPAQTELSLIEAAAARLPQEVPPLAFESVPTASPVPPAAQPARTSTKSPLLGVALAAAIFALAVVAWHAAPWRAPQKVKIEPDRLKLDRSLDLDRILDPRRGGPSKGTTAPSRPS